MRLQQREREVSNSKRNLEQLITQLDRSGVSLNMSTDVEDVRDSKIASLESLLSSLKGEKKELELKLLSLETIQGNFTFSFSSFSSDLISILTTETKECLELEVSDLRASHDQLSMENSMLQARLEKYHSLEGTTYNVF